MPATYDSTMPLISIHVPKTGGSTVRETLKGWFGDNFYPHYVDESVKKPPLRHTQSESICIHGHFNRFRKFGVDDYYPETNQFITFLRDPFEHHVSLFFYLRREAENYQFDGRLSPVASFERFEEFMSYLADQRENIQTTPANTFLAHMPNRFEMYSPNEIFDSCFIHMGTTEDMDASLALLAFKLNKPVVEIQPQNISYRDLPVNPVHRKVHEKMFAAEHEFYNVIKSRHAIELKEAEIG